MTPFARRFVQVVALCLLGLSSFAAPRAEHVFIISLDGGKPAAIEQSQMPVLKRLVAEGAHTWTATTIYPSITLPAHTSMLTGVGPDKHHILWNGWVPSRGVVTCPDRLFRSQAGGLHDRNVRRQGEVSPPGAHQFPGRVHLWPRRRGGRRQERRRRR